MLRIRQLFFISIILCVTFSVKAQSTDYLDAALCEKQAYLADNPMEFNDAIFRKAEILCDAGLYRESLSSLERVRAYSLTPAQRDSLGIRKAYMAYRMEDYDRALSYLQEVDMAPSCGQIHKKSRWAAMFLTFLVPAGFLYAEDPAGAVMYTGLNALSVGGIVLQASSLCYLSAILGGAMALNFTFMGAQEKVALLVEKRNLELENESKRQALNSFFQASSEGRTERPE